MRDFHLRYEMLNRKLNQFDGNFVCLRAENVGTSDTQLLCSGRGHSESRTHLQRSFRRRKQNYIIAKSQ